MVPRTRRLPRGQLYFAALGTLLDVTRHLGPARPPEGSVVRRFERAFAGALGADEAVALPHARTALRYLLQALALPAGSEVLMTPVTIPEVVSVVLMAGLVPVFVDLAERTCNIDVDDLERKVTPRARLLLLTHLCGLPSEMDRVMAVASRHGLEVLEDCSQAPGARHRDRPLGLFGRAGFMSLTPLKPVSSFHGGMTVTGDPSLARELRRLDALAPPPLPTGDLLRLLARDNVLHAVTHRAVFPRLTWYAVRAAEALDPEIVREFQRGNLLNDPARRRRRVERLERLPERMYARYSDAQAAVGLRGLRGLAADNRRRRDLSLLLLELLRAEGVPGLVRLTADESGCTFWRFPLWVDPAELGPLRRRLLARGVDTSPTNLACCSREPAFADLAADTPEARRFTDAMTFLPMHPSMSEADARHVARSVADALSER